MWMKELLRRVKRRIQAHDARHITVLNVLDGVPLRVNKDGYRFTESPEKNTGQFTQHKMVPVIFANELKAPAESDYL